MMTVRHRVNLIQCLLLLSLSLLQVSMVGAATTCGTAERLTKTYLSGLKLGDFANFIPSAYFAGGATKFVSVGETTIFDEELCVDGQTVPIDIQLFDDGTNGDDFANDGIYSRACVHFCESAVNMSDYWGFAYQRDMVGAKLMVVRKDLQGKIPSQRLPNTHYPSAKLFATSHAAFFVDDARVYLPDWPASMTRGSNGDGPNGNSFAAASVLQVFGDVFDFFTVTGIESQTAIQGAGVYKWQSWVKFPGSRIGTAEPCAIAATGVPITRLIGGIINSDIVSWVTAGMHELTHAVAGYDYNSLLDKARTGDGQHVPGSCTNDHSSLQGPIWDWVIGSSAVVPMSYCIGVPDCYTMDGDLLRLEPNQDCATCPDSRLTQCCTFRYEEVYGTKESMVQKRTLLELSPLLLYIAGLLPIEDVPNNKKTYYCMGSDTDGGCGSDDGQPPCTIKVNDANRNRITSDFVSRFTFDELVAAAGGPRDPPTRVTKDFRHAAIHIAQRMPSEAEMTFYTLLWRFHEVTALPWDRVPHPNGSRKEALQTWIFHTNGISSLQSKLHGIPCGGGLQTPSCTAATTRFTGCDNAPCGDGAVCTELDGKPLCTCIEGLVGDGTKCVLPSVTLSYPLMDPYDLFAVDVPRFDNEEKCFGSPWPEFVPKKTLPPYPGGVAPFAATSCGSSVCGVGWQCIAGQCVAPTGKSMCEGHGYSESQCTALGCCVFQQGSCKSGVGSNTCTAPKDPSLICEDPGTCCYFQCRDLGMDSEQEIGQRTNCGGNCAVGIRPDIFGKVHKELYLLKELYIEDGEQYPYSDTSGPLYVEGPNMFERCFNSCFRSTPTPPPTPSPSRPPTRAPTSSPPIAAFCFSKANTVEHQHKGIIPIDQLQLGDFVRDTQNTFGMVYSFGHKNVGSKAHYLRIHATNLDKPVEMSKEHMLFVENDGHIKLSMPASQLKVGDKLVTAQDTLVVVTKVEAVVSEGSYAPFTLSGSIVVNGVVASSYVSLQESSFFVLGGYETPFTMQWMAHAFNAPHRMICQRISWNYCELETYTDTGISNWVATPLQVFSWLLEQNSSSLVLVFFPFVSILAVVAMVEHLLGNMGICAFAVLLCLTGCFIRYDAIKSKRRYAVKAKRIL